MRPIVTNVVWSVCWSVNIVSPADTAEPIRMLFRLGTRAGQRNHVLDGVQIPMAIMREKGQPIVNYRECCPYA